MKKSKVKTELKLAGKMPLNKPKKIKKFIKLLKNAQMVRTIILSKNEILDSDLMSLSQQWPSDLNLVTVTHLYLDNNDITGAGLPYLEKIIKHLPLLRYISLNGNPLNEWDDAQKRDTSSLLKGLLSCPLITDIEISQLADGSIFHLSKKEQKLLSERKKCANNIASSINGSQTEPEGKLAVLYLNVFKSAIADLKLGEDLAFYISYEMDYSIHKAIKSNNSIIARFILENSRYSHHLIGIEGLTPLQLATRLDRKEIIKVCANTSFLGFEKKSVVHVQGDQIDNPLQLEPSMTTDAFASKRKKDEKKEHRKSISFGSGSRKRKRSKVTSVKTKTETVQKVKNSKEKEKKYKPIVTEEIREYVINPELLQRPDHSKLPASHRSMPNVPTLFTSSSRSGLHVKDSNKNATKKTKKEESTFVMGDISSKSDMSLVSPSHSITTSLQSMSLSPKEPEIIQQKKTRKMDSPGTKKPPRQKVVRGKRSLSTSSVPNIFSHNQKTVLAEQKKKRDEDAQDNSNLPESTL